MKKTLLDDGSFPHLVEGARLVGAPGIPELMDLRNSQVPRAIIPFEKAHKAQNKRQYIHFYMFDGRFLEVLTATDKFLNLFSQFDGVITPDCTIMEGRAPCIQQTQTYFSRAVGFYLQKNHIPVIPNIRWGEKSTFDFCFLGVPKKSIVSISTHGCIRQERDKNSFALGLERMLIELEPTDVLVHGFMPESVFGKFLGATNFHRYPSLFEQTHDVRRAN